MAIQDFAWIGVENLVFEDKKSGDALCELKYLVNFNLSDSQPIEYLRGGIKRGKLLPFKGDREISVTVSTATDSEQLRGLMLDSEMEELDKDVMKIDDLLCEAGDGVFTLKATPAEGKVVNVWAKDENGVQTKLVVGDAVEAGTCTVAGTTITCDPSVTRLHVVYRAVEKRYVLKAKDSTVKTFKCTAVLWAQEVGTGNVYTVDLDIPSAAIQLNTNIDASNEGGVPDNIEFTIDALEDAIEDYFYLLAFGEQI